MTTHDLPKGFRMERGLVWPDMDKACAKVIFDMSADLEVAMNFVTSDSRKVCVQAGGNCGVWPRALAPLFGTVYTAEPHPLNFVALTMNTAGLPNVVRLQAAFGYDRDLIKLALADHELENCGAFFVERGGYIPTLRIDDLHLRECGLIYLDIEGMEQNALRGAEHTIRQCRPTIIVEDKGLSEKYGTAKGDCEKWLEAEFEYVVAKRIHRDVILIHASLIGID